VKIPGSGLWYRLPYDWRRRFHVDDEPEEVAVDSV
jgi:hypothetical protein